MVNATEWLETNYPSNGTCTRIEDTENCSNDNAKIRSQIVNLNIDNQDLDGDFSVKGFTNLVKANFSFNKLTNAFDLKISIELEEYDYSNNQHRGDWGGSSSIFPKLKKFNLSHNYITKITFQAPQLTHIDVSHNYLSELNLKGIADLQTLNCSNNLNLENLTLPNNFKPSVLDCYNTYLKNITFSNSSIFDCEKGVFITSTNTTTPTDTITKTATPTFHTIPTTHENLSLKLGLGLGIPFAITLLGLLTFFGYKYKKNRTPEFRVGGNK
ncbi:6451_t:CDS:1 [Diversispora eburnea]|uniref:6451_t:CDS:1 n=1 Tax=Diversispora eburnea TaxID=1213867 RepID=A0A9N8ZWL0_9GLOM|nr:6451_t:CDS:1 [Diversispora eburnea]